MNPSDGAPSRDALVAHLVASRIAGDVATPRASNLANIRKMLARHPEYWFGLELERSWTFDAVLDAVSRRVGIDPDPARLDGADRIDPELCVDALDAAGRRIGEVAAAGGTVLLATGHPTGLLAMLASVAIAAQEAGATVVTPGAERWVEVLGESRRVRYVGGVATVGTGGDLLHTHAAEPMQALLGWCERPIDLVVADHGWAGAAAQAGVPTVGFADANDPALFVGADEGKLDVVVPLDDNVAPAAYEPLTRFLQARVRGLARTDQRGSPHLSRDAQESHRYASR